jgi:Flp pilus assembly protein TadD
VDKGLIDEAIENLRKAIALTPSDLAARNNLAKLLLQKGKVDEAKAEFGQVLKADPNNADARAGLEKIQMGLTVTGPAQP